MRTFFRIAELWSLSVDRAFLFHPSQSVLENADGTLTVHFTAGGIDELCWHLVTWGNRVTIEQPAHLRQRLAAICAGLAEHRRPERRKSRNMAYQGSLDGLCGPYAIVNAYRQCDIEEKWLGQDIFAISCLAIEGWPQILWDGTSFRDMRKMLKSCQNALQSAYEEADCEYPIKVTYPFWKKPPRTNKEYWKRLDEIFCRNDVLCGIIGMEHPSEHWFAFDKKAKTLTAFDSTHHTDGGMRRIAIKDIHAGVHEKKKYVVNRRELIVFRSA